jgi:DNA-binding FadR family transcriptional regulator
MATHMAIYTVIAEGDSAQASRIMGEHCHRHARLLLHPSTRLPASRAVSVSSA